MRSDLVALLVLLVLAPSASAHDAQAETTQASEIDPPNTWVLGAIANGAMALLFAAIAFLLWRAIIQGGQLRSNPLLTGMALIFTTCSIGHAVHFEHSLLPYYAPHVPSELLLEASGDAVGFGLFAQLGMSDPLLVAADLSAAGSTAFYWSVRNRHGAMIRGAELADDLDLREREAQAVHDTIVRRTERALALLDAEKDDKARQEIGETLKEAQGIVDIFLGGSDLSEDLGPGELTTSPTERP